MFRSNFFRSNIPTRIVASATLIALTAASAAQATTIRTINSAAQTRAAAVSVSAASNCSGCRFAQIDDPMDKTFNQLLGINDQGIIAGYFGSSAIGHPNTGYTIAPTYNTYNTHNPASFVSDNLPSSTQTQATGIVLNAPTSAAAATTSGFWAPTNLGPGLDANYGFVRLGLFGAILWLSVSDPLVSSTPKVNQALGVNGSYAVGFYNDANNNSHGWVYSLANGQFSHPFIDQFAVSSAITGINDTNTICGFYLDKNNGFTKGFVKLPNGAVVHYLVPGSKFTQFLGINDADEAVGFYNDANGVPHGIVYNVLKNALTIVNEGKAGTTLNGINNKHQAVGFFADGKMTDLVGNEHGLLVSNIP